MWGKLLVWGKREVYLKSKEKSEKQDLWLLGLVTPFSTHYNWSILNTESYFILWELLHSLVCSGPEKVANLWLETNTPWLPVKYSTIYELLKQRESVRDFGKEWFWKCYIAHKKGKLCWIQISKKIIRRR